MLSSRASTTSDREPSKRNKKRANIAQQKKMRKQDALAFAELIYDVYMKQKEA